MTSTPHFDLFQSRAEALADEDAPFDPDYDTPPPASPPRYLTPDPFTLTGAVEAADDADYLLEHHFWATAVVGRDRLIELNRLIADEGVERGSRAGGGAGAG